MPAIASLEDLKAAQKDLLEAKDLDELKKVFKKWRRIGWKNVCKLVVTGANTRTIERRGGLRFPKGKISGRIQLHPLDPVRLIYQRLAQFVITLKWSNEGSYSLRSY